MNETIDEQHDRQLWCAVLSQAITDATTKRIGKDAQRDQRAAIEWLSTDNRDFRTVCTLAGVDPEAVRDRLMRLLPPRGVVEKFQNRCRDQSFPSAQERTELEFSRL